jgi:uncharacterized membrane protein YgaE (UPF0421/DUF939 family)
LGRRHLLDRWKERRDRVAGLLGAQSSGRIGLSYVLRTISAAVLAILVCHLLGIVNPIWALVSAVVVIMPTTRASIASAALRVVANFIGAGVGAAIWLIGLPSIVAVVLGLPVVAALCRLLGLDAAARSASVALIIVSLKEPGGVLGSSEGRVLQVILGCTVALLDTVIAAGIERMVKGRIPTENRSS